MSRYNSYEPESKRASIISSLVYLCFVTLWGMGIFHSYKKHSKIDFAASFLPPWGWYRGAESFWHKSTKMNWDERLKSDATAMLMLLTVMPETMEAQAEVDKTVVAFSERIKDYTPARISYIKDAADMYVRFYKAVAIDMTSFIENILLKDGNMLASNWAETSKPILDSIISFYNVQGINKEYKQIEEDLRTAQNGFREKGISPEESQQLLDNLKDVDKTDRARIRKIYKAVFNQEPNF